MLAGEKIWVMRSGRRNFRGRFGLIPSDSEHIIGRHSIGLAAGFVSQRSGSGLQKTPNSA